MIKKLIPLVMLLLFISLSFAAEPVPDTQLRTFSAEEISNFEKRFREIDIHMNYLKEKMVEQEEIISMYAETERLFRELKTSPDISDLNMAREYLTSKLNILEETSKERVSYVRRMDFMYQAMVVMGMAIIIFMIIYSIYMFARRK